MRSQDCPTATAKAILTGGAGASPSSGLWTAAARGCLPRSSEEATSSASTGMLRIKGAMLSSLARCRRPGSSSLLLRSSPGRTFVGHQSAIRDRIPLANTMRQAKSRKPRSIGSGKSHSSGKTPRTCFSLRKLPEFPWRSVPAGGHHSKRRCSLAGTNSRRSPGS